MPSRGIVDQPLCDVFQSFKQASSHPARVRSSPTIIGTSAGSPTAAGEALDEEATPRPLPRAIAPPPRLAPPFEAATFLGAMKSRKDTEKSKESKESMKKSRTKTMGLGSKTRWSMKKKGRPFI
jgi:hypothetical protein